MRLDYIDNRDNVEGLRALPADCIDLTVTSPPYDNLRKYNGFSWDFETLARELFRVTKPGGVVVWVVGDATVKGSETGTSFRQALYFKDCGFNLHDTMIYEKVNPIPQNHNRYEQCFEYMFVLTKGVPKTFNGLKTQTKNAGKVFDWGGRKTEMDAAQCRRHRDHEKKEVRPDKLRRNIFQYAIGGGNTGHPAVFPEQLAADHVLTWSNPGDVVLDPFMGSGTTAKMAMEHGRHYIGFEISAEYCAIAAKRLQSVTEAAAEVAAAAEEEETEDWLG